MLRLAVKSFLFVSSLLLTACGTTSNLSSSVDADTRPVVEDASRTKSTTATSEKAALAQKSKDTSSAQVELLSVDDLSSLSSVAVGAEPHGTSHAVDDESEGGEATALVKNKRSTANIDRKVRGNAPPVRKTAKKVVNKGNAASRSLLASSQSQMASGNYRLAANSAERALRVSPRNPQAYYQLALIYQKQSQHAKALHFAEKALAQKGVSSRLRRQLWLLKAQCYTALGDEKSAQNAKQKAG